MRQLKTVARMSFEFRSVSRVVAVSTIIALSIGLQACGGGGGSTAGAAAANPRVNRTTPSALLRWAGFRHVLRVVDLSGPGGNGTIVVATAGRLARLGRGGLLEPFARGPGGYSGPVGLEPYIALSTGRRVAAVRCRFARNDVYALRLGRGRGVTVVNARGQARRFVRLGGGGLENGIAFDTTGRFGYRLLVTSVAGGKTTVFAIDCRGRVATLTLTAPNVEGGMAVAPASFGRFAGDLIAANEISGKIYAIGPDGRSNLIADSGLPHGQDIGVESAGFVPPGFGAGWSAFVSDRRTTRNRHPGDDLILALGGSALNRAGVRSGDLLLASEGGALTIDVACARTCRVRKIAQGPQIAHVEGHIVFRRGK